MSVYDRSAPLELSHRGRIILGLTIAAPSALILGIMIQHPTIESHEISMVVEEVLDLSSANSRIHGTIIGFLVIILGGLSCFSSRLGAKYMAAPAALVFYLIGAVSLIGAALISGFVVSEITQSLVDATPAQLEIYRRLLRYSWILNQTLAKFGSILIIAGIFMWSIGLLRFSGATRMIGVFGMVGGLVASMIVIFALTSIGVFEMTAILVFVVAWNVGTGIQIIRDQA